MGSEVYVVNIVHFPYDIMPKFTALAQVKTIACDVREEYIHYLQLDTSHKA